MKTIQLKAMKPCDRSVDDVIEAKSRDEASIFSIYKGEFGAFVWQADFADPEVAYLHASKWQAESKGLYRLDTTQFDAVMNPEPAPKFPEGFVEWHGGQCPVDPATKVQVILRRDTRDHPDMVRPAVNWVWPHAEVSSDIVAYKVVEEAKPAEPTGHPHADLMAQYAEDAKTHREPWTLWECRVGPDGWHALEEHPLWELNAQYRRKPAQTAPFGDPTRCPFCGDTGIAFMKHIHGSEYSRGEVIHRAEYQCRSETCGRFFWS